MTVEAGGGGEARLRKVRLNTLHASRWRSRVSVRYSTSTSLYLPALFSARESVERDTPKRAAFRVFWTSAATSAFASTICSCGSFGARSYAPRFFAARIHSAWSSRISAHSSRARAPSVASMS